MLQVVYSIKFEKGENWYYYFNFNFIMDDPHILILVRKKDVMSSKFVRKNANLAESKIFGNARI